MPSVSAVAFWVAKRGNSEAEWEDHFGLDEGLGRFAVADGASSSPKAAVWARSLTTGFLTDPFEIGRRDALDDWIQRRCDQFAVEHPRADVDDVTPENWYTQAAEGKDGFATLIAAQFGPSPDAVATVDFVGVGDACLFHLRDGALLAAAPELGTDGFTSFPDLISTNDDHREQAVEGAFSGRCSLRVGDEVLLVSDALAEWALSTAPREPEVWGVLSELDAGTFDRLIGDLREHDEIVNDDVTFVRCRVIA